MIRKRVPCVYCRRLFYPNSRCRNPKACSDPECQRRRRNSSHKQWRDDDPQICADRREASREWRRNNPGHMQKYRKKHPEYVEDNRRKQQRRRFLRRVVKSIVIAAQPLEKSNEFVRPRMRCNINLHSLSPRNCPTRAP